MFCKIEVQIEFVSGVSIAKGQELVSVIAAKGFNFAVCFYDDIIISTELFPEEIDACAILQRYDKQLISNPPGNLASEIVNYFNGQNAVFNCRLIRPSSDFAFQVYHCLLGIGYGQTISYRQLAILAGRRGACRTVGSLMKNNPYPVIVPCHRVIRSDGSLGQYSGGRGPATKEYLHKLENQSGR